MVEAPPPGRPPVQISRGAALAGPRLFLREAVFSWRRCLTDNRSHLRCRNRQLKFRGAAFRDPSPKVPGVFLEVGTLLKQLDRCIGLEVSVLASCIHSNQIEVYSTVLKELMMEG